MMVTQTIRISAPARGRFRGVIKGSGLIELKRTTTMSPDPFDLSRLVIVKIKPHISKGKYKGGTSGVDSDGYLRIATNLMNVPAEIIALLYEYRWTIEIFFRQFKHLLGCRHLLSHNQNGIAIQTYCAHHRLFTHRSLDRSKTDQTHPRNVVLLPDRLGLGRRSCSAHREAERSRQADCKNALTPLLLDRRLRSEPLHAAHSTAHH